MNKSELALKIQSLEGLSNEEKRALLELLRGHKKYGLVWEEKPEDIEERLREDLPVLVEVKEKAIIAHSNLLIDSELPNHIIIEGDNLAALTELSYTHAGRIDVIYIDPPYNTGNKDFVYNDSYVDTEDCFRHSKWLSFMSKRLRIAKTLLSERGVIFISIGDDEICALKLLCDELFQNIALVPRIAKKGSNQGTFFRPTKDYVLVYCNNIDAVLPFVDVNASNETRTYNFIDEKTGRRYRKGHSFFQASLDPLRGCRNQRYYMTAPDGTLIIPPGNAMPNEEVDAAFVVPQTREDKVWRWSYQSYLQKKDRIMFTKSKRSPLIDSNGNHTDWNAYEIKFADEEATENLTLPNDVITEFINTLGTNVLSDLRIDFSYSKPVELIKYLILIAQFQDNAKILDFFAGSGTTLHAVMQLNAEDGGHRQCILCTNNENGICENVTYERNKRVIEGYTKPNGEHVEGLHDNNLRYYRTEFLPRERSAKNMRDLVEASTGLLCIKNDIYTEAPFGGRKMKAKYARYFESVKGRMLVIYEERAIPYIADIIKTLPEGDVIKVYVFSHGSYAYDDEFAEVADRVTLCALPQAIYDAYQKVLPKRKPKFLVEDLVEEIVEQEITENQGLFAFDNNSETGGREA